MRFALLGSGSRGNALLVEQGDTTLMVDCGFTLRESERRLARLKKAPASPCGDDDGNIHMEFPILANFRFAEN